MTTQARTRSPLSQTDTLILAAVAAECYALDRQEWGVRHFATLAAIHGYQWGRPGWVTTPVSSLWVLRQMVKAGLLEESGNGAGWRVPG